MTHFPRMQLKFRSAHLAAAPEFTLAAEGACCLSGAVKLSIEYLSTIWARKRAEFA
jgi:hypothetical protein